MPELHAHVEAYAVDCDGPVYRSSVMTMTEEEKADLFPDLTFKAAVLDSQVSFHPEHTCEISITRDGFTMNQATDEGSRASEIRWCEDDCDTDVRSRRDVFAEQMGY